MSFHWAWRKALCITALALAVTAPCAIAVAAGGGNSASRPAPAARPQIAPVPVGDADKTLAALHDELQRSKDRLALPDQERPYYIEYRLIDVDVRTISAQFGALLSSTTTRNRFMSVDVRVGDYKLDSSNFLGAQGFRGFLGSTGTVGIDGDYDSLRQDLWLATDQAYKQALDALSNKRGFLRSLANAPTIDDFSQELPMVEVRPRIEPDWTSRNWEAEAKTVSGVLRDYPELSNSRVTYHLIYTTSYLFSTEGTQIRVSKSFSAVEAAMGAQANDGMPLRNFLAIYAERPAGLPPADTVRQQLSRAGQQLVALRVAPLVQDYEGPILFEAPAAGSLVAQLLGPSLGGARGPLSVNSRFDQMMQTLGGRSDWTGRLTQRVLPTHVSVIDDPSARQFQGQELLGSYDADEEGVRAEKVAVVTNGILRELLMSRRPGPDIDRSNGHGRSTFLADARPMMANLFFTSSEGQSPAELRKKFLDACRENGQRYGLLVRQMDNPVLGSTTQEELSEAFGVLAAGAPNGNRMPLLVYRVNVDDGSEQLVRGTILSGLTTRSLRNLLGIGNDNTVFSFAQSQQAGISGTALGAFGSADGGVPTSVIAPSLLFEEIEVRGPHNEPRRMPLVPPPAL